MKLTECWIEHPVRHIDRTFTYYYDGDITPGVRVSVNFAHRNVIGFVESVTETQETLEEAEKRLGISLKPVLSVLDDAPLITPELHDLAMWMRENTLSTAISCFQCMLPGKIKPGGKITQAVLERRVRILDNEVSLTPKQLSCYREIAELHEASYTEMRKKYPSVLAKLIEKGAVEVFSVEKEAVMPAGHEEDEKTLTPQQQKAVDEVRNSDDPVFLIKGVTGSGKTEVYLNLARRALEEGRQVLILVPEIALTPQMIERVSKRFSNVLAIYHSGLNPQEKYEQYKLVYSNKARVIVGTRSAVFLPFRNLGLIVMDEEHDTSYKQENQPAYHCRDVAIWRGKYHHCPVVLGSATPSLESYARAVRKVYHLILMDERINMTLPEISVVDIRKAMQEGQSYILSDELAGELKNCLDRRQQAILLLNRRGYHSVIRCRSCQTALKCPHCDIAMSWHRDERLLKCHTCGTVMRVPKACPECGSTAGFTAFGFGTQKLEAELQEKFPAAKVLRMDADTTGRKNAHEKILKAFGNGEADILLGTQMIAKGLDYPNVTLVGIINGDEGIARTDFRSCELSFDLLMQASGRSGRSEYPGKVILQVFDPGHYAVQCAAQQDYDTFFVQEMRYRHAGMYPPYTYLIALTVSSDTQDKADKDAYVIRQALNGSYKTIGVLTLLKINDRCRSRVLLKGQDLEEMRRDVRAFLDSPEGSRIKDLRIDVNPLVLD